MRRRQPNPEVRERLLAAAERLVLSQGFAATTVDAVCAAAGVSKGSFFYYFPTKEDLARALIGRYCANTHLALGAAPFTQEGDPVRRLLGRLDFHIEASRHPEARWCVLGTLTQEVAESHPALRALCAQGFAGFAEDIQRDLEAAIAARGLEGVEPQSLAEHFLAVLEGGLLLAKAKQDMEVFRQSMAHLRRYVQLLFGR